ncbi:MAG: extracellular solute-binding protein, partial [Deltaproteobacteria bacterium]|nr:extracellular solute-binding protein [Nannocystaceae bacterium]
MIRAAWWMLLALVCAWPSHVRAEAPLRLWHAWRGAEEAALVETLRGWDGPPVEVLAIPYDAFSSKLGSAIPFGEGPDVYVESHERLGEYRRRELVAPIELDRSVFEPVAWSAVTIDGEALALPLSLKSQALYVNDALVDTVPRTLEDIVALQPSLPDGVVALAYEAQSPYAHAPILHAFGGRLLADDGSFGFVGPEAVASLELVAAMLDAGAVPREADGALVTNLFRAGKAAFAMSGPWLASDLSGEHGDVLRYHVVPLPRLGATGQLLAPLLTVEAVMLSPSGAAKPEARALAAFLADAGAAKLRMQRARMVSARTDVPSDDPLVRAFAEQA